jgi:hypothetical protein
MELRALPSVVRLRSFSAILVPSSRWPMSPSLDPTPGLGSPGSSFRAPHNQGMVACKSCDNRGLWASGIRFNPPNPPNFRRSPGCDISRCVVLLPYALALLSRWQRHTKTDYVIKAQLLGRLTTGRIRRGWCYAHHDHDHDISLEFKFQSPVRRSSTRVKNRDPLSLKCSIFTHPIFFPHPFQASQAIDRCPGVRAVWRSLGKQPMIIPTSPSHV